MIRQLCIATTLFATVITPARADAPTSVPYTWQSVKVGGGGYIPGIVFSRAEKGLAYLRSDMGGCYRWQDSVGHWTPLNDAIGESSYHGGESIAPDPVDPHVLYIAAGMYRSDPAAILRSTDKGNHWSIFPVPFRMGGNEDGRGLGERLAIDPASTNILYFGSRHDGLQRSTDKGEHWSKVDSFPLKGRGLVGWDKPANIGLSFVVFTPTESSSPTKTIFVGSADPGDTHLFRSDDAGATWIPVPNQPNKDLLPAQAQYDDAGHLYLTYANNPGPNGVTDGAVYILDIKSNSWTNITPDPKPDRPKGGYTALSLDRQHPGTLAVATMNRWYPTDTVWRTTDNGQSWHEISSKATRDVSSTPFLHWGKSDSRLGWWMSALAIDPFDSDRACYATGATIYMSKDFSNVSKDAPTHWMPWTQGIEQTAIICLLSPPAGPHLLSGFGDIGGFPHDDLSVSPPQGMYENPQFGNTNTLDCADLKPNVIVRSGRPNEKDAPHAYSEDGGHTWKPLILPTTPSTDSRRPRPAPALTISADGSTIFAMTPTPILTRDHGATWTPVKTLPQNLRIIPDRTDPTRACALDFATGTLHTSTDAGATFSPSHPTGLPSDLKSDRPTSHEAPWPLAATPTLKGDLWLTSKQGLYHSTDAGKTFTKSDTPLHIDALSFGKAPPNSPHPTLFAIGTLGNLKAIWRSTDSGATWLRINDDTHQYGTRFRCLAGDPRLFGRVYVGTDGRGILYADPKE